MYQIFAAFVSIGLVLAIAIAGAVDFQCQSHAMHGPLCGHAIQHFTFLLK